MKVVELPVLKLTGVGCGDISPAIINCPGEVILKPLCHGGFRE